MDTFGQIPTYFTGRSYYLRTHYICCALEIRVSGKKNYSGLFILGRMIKTDLDCSYGGHKTVSRQKKMDL